MSAGYICLPAEEVSVSSPCGLLIGIYTFYGNGSTENFRKESLALQNSANQYVNLKLPPKSRYRNREMYASCDLGEFF